MPQSARRSERRVSTVPPPGRDSDLIKVRRAGVEPAQREAGGLQPLGLANAQPTRNWSSL